jgi:hypothetical protein
MTYDQLCDVGHAQDRDEMLERAAFQVADAIAAERGRAEEPMANGDVCYGCGEAFDERQGMPTLCTHCGGNVSTGSPRVPPTGGAALAVPPTQSPWYVGERYFANAYDAAIVRRRSAEKAARFAARVAAAERRRSLVEVDFTAAPERYIGALAFLALAWESGDFARYRQSMQADVSPELLLVGENEDARWMAGVRAWRAAEAPATLSRRAA